MNFNTVMGSIMQTCIKRKIYQDNFGRDNNISFINIEKVRA